MLSTATVNSYFEDLSLYWWGKIFFLLSTGSARLYSKEKNSLTYGLEIHMPFKWKQTPKSPTYLLGFCEQKPACTLWIPLGLNLQYNYLSLADINPLQRNRSSPSWLFKAPLSLPTCVPQPPRPVLSLLVLLCYWEILLYLKYNKRRDTLLLKHKKVPLCMVLLTSLPILT